MKEEINSLTKLESNKKRNEEPYLSITNRFFNDNYDINESNQSKPSNKKDDTILYNTPKVVNIKPPDVDINYLTSLIPNIIKEGVVIENQEKNIIYANHSFLRFTKLSKNQLIGKSWKHTLSKLIDKGEKRDTTPIEGNPLIEAYFCNTKHEKKYMEISTVPLYKNNCVVAKMHIIIDTPKLEKHADRIKKTKTDIQTVEKLQNALLANMSHEFRTPLNAIIGLSSILKDKDDLSRTECCEYLNIIEEKGYELLEILTNLIEIARFKAKSIKIKPSKFDVNQLIEECYLKFKQNVELNQQPLLVKMNIPASHDEFYINTDRYYLNQIFSFLLENAGKFTTKGEIQIGYHHNKGALEFFVHDTGILIPPKESEYLFEQFWLGEEYHSRNVGSTGIKMNICNEMVKLLGGDIKVESHKKLGTMFIFTIATNDVGEESEGNVSL